MIALSNLDVIRFIAQTIDNLTFKNGWYQKMDNDFILLSAFSP